MILLDFYFIVCIKPSQSHQHVDHLSKITSGESPIGVDDKLFNAALFIVDIVPQWAEPILEIMFLDVLHARANINKLMNLLETSKKYAMILGHLYKQGFD